jgi:GTP-binding protein HflX
VLNKTDLLSPLLKETLESSVARAGDSGPILVSAKTGKGIDELLRRVDAALPIDPVVMMSLRMPMTEGRTLALIHAMGKVLHSIVEDSHMRMVAEVPESIARRLRLSQYSVRGTPASRSA